MEKLDSLFKSVDLEFLEGVHPCLFIVLVITSNVVVFCDQLFVEYDLDHMLFADLLLFSFRHVDQDEVVQDLELSRFFFTFFEVEQANVGQGKEPILPFVEATIRLFLDEAYFESLYKWVLDNVTHIVGILCSSLLSHNIVCVQCVDDSLS